MSTVITRLFDDYDHARQAVSDLEAGGIAHDRVSIVANNSDGRYDASAAGATRDSTAMTDGTPSEEAATGAGTGATLGTLLGGGGGLLAGLGMLAIPGVGPVVAAGWLVATAVGAGVGAASGGLLGSLVGAGVSEEDANVYAEGVRRGSTLVTVRAEDNEAAMVEQVMAKYNGIDAAPRGQEYRSSGWEKFDETSPAYTAATPGAMSTPSPGMSGAGTTAAGTTATPGILGDTTTRPSRL